MTRIYRYIPLCLAEEYAWQGWAVQPFTVHHTRFALAWLDLPA